jgi:dihydrolipoamide dehydrogenase
MDEILKLPKLALNMTEGTVLKWLKQEGDLVAKGDQLVEVGTGKVNVQVDAPVSGRLVKIIVPAHSKVPVGEELAVIKLEEVCADGEEMGQMYDAALGRQEFDVVVIGGGPGGYVAAIRASRLGGRVALVEKDKLGGVCLNRGCIPTKTLVKSAGLFDSFRSAGEFGLKVQEPAVDLVKIMERKKQVVEQLGRGIAQLLKANCVTLVRGAGNIEGRGRVKVRRQCDEIVLQAKNIIIATGSRPARVPIPGAGLDGVLNSDEILDMDSLPGSLIIIGGGVIGVEMAWIFSALGAKVSIIELQQRILPPVDEEIALQITEILREKGIGIYTGTGVRKISKVEGGGFYVEAAGADDGEKNFYGEKVLISTGRTLNTEGLNLEGAGIVTWKGAIKVDGRMMTSVQGVYAVGDVTGGMLLAHVASAQGMVAAENAMGRPGEMDYSSVPCAIFTSPEIGTVGLTEQQAIEKGYRVKVSRFPFAASGKALAMGATEGQLKLICDEAGGKILGAHILGPHATDLIAVLAVSMQNGLTAGQIARTIFAHPTTAEVIAEAAHGIIGKAIHLP